MKEAEVITKSTIELRWYNGEYDNVEYFEEGMWFKAIDFDFVYNGIKYVRFKPKDYTNPNSIKWQNRSRLIKFEDIKHGFTLANMLEIYKHGYLYFSWDFQENEK
jgi:hypothetical protein